MQTSPDTFSSLKPCHLCWVPDYQVSLFLIELPPQLKTIWKLIFARRSELNEDSSSTAAASIHIDSGILQNMSWLRIRKFVYLKKLLYIYLNSPHFVSCHVRLDWTNFCFIDLHNICYKLSKAMPVCIFWQFFIRRTILLVYLLAGRFPS